MKTISDIAVCVTEPATDLVAMKGLCLLTQAAAIKIGTFGNELEYLATHKAAHSEIDVCAEALGKLRAEFDALTSNVLKLAEAVDRINTAHTAVAPDAAGCEVVL